MDHLSLWFYNQLQITIEAIDQKTGERFIVRYSNLYDGSVELAQQVEIELQDG